MSGVSDNSTSVPDNTNGGFASGSSGALMYVGIASFIGLALLIIVFYVRSMITNPNGGLPFPPTPRTPPDTNSTRQSTNLGLDLEDISCLPTFPYQPIKRRCRNKGHEHKENVLTAECAVCLGELEEGEMVRVLPTCKHYFHVKCIDTWLSTCSSCPMCRAHPDPEKVREGSVSISPPWRQVMYSSSSERRQFGLGSCLGSPFVKTPSKSPSILGTSSFHGSWQESPYMSTPQRYLHRISAEAHTP